MKEDRQARQLAKLELIRRRTNERMEARRLQYEARFDRARQRITGDTTDPSDDQKRYIAAALELLDEVGLQEMSLRKLAAKLDIKAPALYWHFKNKEALIDYMAESMLRSALADMQPRSGDQPWQDWLIDMCKRLRSVMLDHRDGARVIAGAHVYPAVTLMRTFELSMESLTSAGIEPERASLIFMTCIHFVFGNVIEEQANPSLEEMRQIDIDAVRRQFPLMADTMERAIHDTESGYDSFEDALRLIIGPTSA